MVVPVKPSTGVQDALETVPRGRNALGEGVAIEQNGLSPAHILRLPMIIVRRRYVWLYVTQKRVVSLGGGSAEKYPQFPVIVVGLGVGV
jgi:hypothetical protein